jgi:prepilin-type N-terminal cleavage/methylation domain-containing protein/prepilin-type processing-associated H-X9-DG protein
MKPSTVKETGFTLIELLVVLAIVAIVAALLLPVISRARQKAQKAVCISNLHQLGIGLRSFVADNNAYPSMNGPTNPYNWDWASQIGTEISGNSKLPTGFLFHGIWRCPSAPRVIHVGPPSNITGPFCSYGYNAYGVLPAWTTNLLGLDNLPRVNSISRLVGLPPVPEPGVAVPADMVAIGDSIDGMVLFRRWLREFGAPPPPWRAAERHQGRINVLFCDYHVESPTVKFVFEDKSDAALVRWNRDHQPHREALMR